MQTGSIERTEAIQWTHRLGPWGQTLRAWVGGTAVTLFASGAAATVLLVPHFRSKMDGFEPIEAVLSQLGATYGTILALVLTLSLIPIQRAAEVWSPSIVQLYRRDFATYVTFVTLGIFCAASFFLSVRGLFMPSSMVLSLALVTLGISLDLLRWYHGHVCRLLNPVHAIGLELTEAKRTIDRIRSHVTRISRMKHQSLFAGEAQAPSIESLESIIYPQIPGYPDSITYWINDLAEICVKAVTRGEKLLARFGVAAIAELTVYYLKARQSNLRALPSSQSMLSPITSDVCAITTPAYESLQEVSRVAARQGDEDTAIRVTEAYGAVAIHTAHLKTHAFRDNSSPLTAGPIYYALMCVKFSQSKGLDEIPFQSANILSKVSKAAPKDIDETDIHLPIIDGLGEIAMYFYGKKNQGLAEDINGYHFSILTNLLQRKDYYFKSILRHVLEKLQTLAPIAITIGTAAPRHTLVRPLGKAYGLVNRESLAYIFEQAAETLVEIDVEREWVNPYHNVIEVADVIAKHLRTLADSNEFGESFLLCEIDHSIKYISNVIAKMVQHPVRPDHGDETDLIDKLLWILAFYWAAIHGKRRVSANRADEFSDSLTFIGLRFYELGHPEVLQSCISYIRSIIDAYSEIAQPAAPYILGDLFAHLWGIRLILVQRRNDALTQEVDRVLAKPRGLTEQQWQNAEQAIMRRREQLEERLASSDHHSQRDSAEWILRRLFQNPPTHLSL